MLKFFLRLLHFFCKTMVIWRKLCKVRKSIYRFSRLLSRRLKSANISRSEQNTLLLKNVFCYPSAVLRCIVTIGNYSYNVEKASTRFSYRSQRYKAEELEKLGTSTRLIHGSKYTRRIHMYMRFAGISKLTQQMSPCDDEAFLETGTLVKTDTHLLTRS